MLYDRNPSSTVHASFSCVVKTIYLAHVLMERPFGSCIHNEIFSKISLKTVSMYGSRVLVFVIRSITEFFQILVELQVVMILHPHVMLYWPYTNVLCKSSSYNLVRMQFHEKWMLSSSNPWCKVCFLFASYGAFWKLSSRGMLVCFHLPSICILYPIHH